MTEAIAGPPSPHRSTAARFAILLVLSSTVGSCLLLDPHDSGNVDVRGVVTRDGTPVASGGVELGYWGPVIGFPAPVYTRVRVASIKADGSYRIDGDVPEDRCEGISVTIWSLEEGFSETVALDRCGSHLVDLDVGG